MEMIIHTANPRMKMLTVKVLRIGDVLWNSAFIIEMPGAITDEHKGLMEMFRRLAGLDVLERTYVKNVIPLTKPRSVNFLESG